MADFAGIIKELQEHGLTQTDIAEKVGATQAFISQLATGNRIEPRYSIGARLVKLRNELCKASTDVSP